MNKKTKELNGNQRMALWALSQKPMTTSDLAEFLNCSQSCAVTILRKLRNAGLAYVSGHRKTNGRDAPIHAVHVSHPKPPRKRIQPGGDSCMREAIETAIREAGWMTAAELAEYIGVKRYQVNATLTHHRDGGRKTGVFRVAEWVWVDRYGWVASYGLGSASDAEKPKPDKAANQARHLENKRSLNRVKHKTFAGNPFGELIHMAGATFVAARFNQEAA